MKFVVNITLWIAVLYVGLREFTFVKANAGCIYKKKNYTACAIMLYTKWTPCNGTDCQLGLQKRDIGLCCPQVGNETIAVIKENCKANCNLSDSDFFELSPYTPPSTTLATVFTSVIRTVPLPSSTTLSTKFTSTKTLVPISKTLSSLTPRRTWSSTLPRYTSTDKAIPPNAPITKGKLDYKNCHFVSFHFFSTFAIHQPKLRYSNYRKHVALIVK